MTAKFDGKRARENMWVTHQNLARAKGGRALYQPKRKAPVAPPKNANATAPVARSSAEVPAPVADDSKD